MSAMWKRRLRMFTMVFALAVIWALFQYFTDGAFLQARNIENLFRQMSVTAIVATGMTLVIVAGHVDLSVGSVVAFLGACLTLMNTTWHWSPTVSAVMTVALGAAVGGLSGLLVAHQKIPAFIVTLGGMMVFRGLALAVTGGNTVPIENNWLQTVGTGISPIAVLAFVLAALFVISRHTVFGRHVFAVGGGLEAARLSGVKTRMVVGLSFVLLGTLTGIASIVLSSRVGSASPDAGQLLELDAIAACVIGGTSLMGGRGSVLGAILGALVMESLNNGMSLANMEAFWQFIIKGMVLVAAVWIDTASQRSRA